MKSILRLYYLKEFFGLFAVIALGLALISGLIDLIDKIDDFITHNPPVESLLLYTALNVPRYLVYLMPMAALLSGLFVFGQAGKRKETLAIKAAGGSIKSLLTPFVYSGVLLCFAGLLISEFVVPDFSAMAHDLRDMMTKRDRIVAFKGGTAWLRVREYVVKIDLYLPDRGVIKGVSIMKIVDDMLIERIEAESGEWQPAWEAGTSRVERRLESPGTGRSAGGGWYLKGVTLYDLRTGKTTEFKEMESDIIDSPEIIGRSARKPEEMNVRELFAYSKRLKEAGIRNTKLVIDIHSRLSYPLINLIMVVAGISLAARERIKGGLVTAATGIAIGLLYWLGFTASLSMGYTGILPPVLAAWLVPMLFGGGALYLFRVIPE